MAARETAGGVSSEPKSPKKSKASATVQSLMTDRAGNQRDNKTDAGTITLFHETLASQLKRLFPD